MTNFHKLIRDSKIMDDSKVTPTSLNLILSSECSMSNNIKTITFEQFLNIILRISELKYTDLYQRHPKQALNSLINHYLVSHLENIESAVEHQNDEYTNSLYSVSEVTLRTIIYNEDT